MATVYYNPASGEIVGFARNADDVARFFAPPPVGASTITFDESTNAGIVNSLTGRAGHLFQSHDVLGGQLRRAGQVLAIAADSPEKTDRADFDGQLSAALTRLTTIKAQADAGMTNAQRDNAIGDLAVMLRRTLRILNQLRQLQR